MKRKSNLVLGATIVIGVVVLCLPGSYLVHEFLPPGEMLRFQTLPSRFR